MTTIQFKNVDKIYTKDTHIVKNFNLDIDDGEFVVFLGPSGCGKSTTLRMLSGLEEVSGGEILIGDQVVNELSPKDRNIAMVFQSYALYPHMTVFENIAFSLKMGGIEKYEIEKRVREIADMLQLTPFLNRKPKALSGGQRQRVAMGRAMIRTPDVFLFDEPLSNLDAKLRNKMRSELKELHQKFKKTTVYVTHDQVEAMTLADKIVILREGVIEQVGTPKDIYHHPVNKFVAGFIGSPTMNMFPVTLLKRGDDMVVNLKGEVIAKVSNYEMSDEVEVGTLGFRPTDVSLEKSSASIKLSMQIENMELLGSTILIHGRVSDQSVTLEVESDQYVQNSNYVDIYINQQCMHVFDSKGRSVVLY